MLIMFHHRNLKGYLLKLLSHRLHLIIVFTPALSYYGTKTRVKFTWSCLKQSLSSYTLGKVVKICIVYELGASGSRVNDPMLKKSWFGAVTLTKNADIDKYGCSGYGTGFDRGSSFTFPGGGLGQKVIIFGADMSSSVHVDNKKRHFNYWFWSYTRIRTYFNFRKNVFN